MTRILAMVIGLVLAAYVACGEPAVAVDDADLVRDSSAVSGTVELTLSLLGDPVELVVDDIAGRIELTAVPGVSTAVEALELRLEDLAFQTDRAPFPIVLRDVRIESTAVAWSTEEGARVSIPCLLRAELLDPDRRRLPIEIPFSLEAEISGGGAAESLHIEGGGEEILETFPLALERVDAFVVFE